MKDSHFKTPRRMSDATFQYWADPIEPDDAEKAHPAEWFFLALVVFAFVMMALGVMQ